MGIARQAGYVGARILRRMARVLESTSDAQTIAIERGMSTCDMERSPDERYYTRQYLRWLTPEIERRWPRGDAIALDIGCGKGRLSLPLARILSQGRVFGIDLAQSAVDAARAKAADYGFMNAEFHAGDARSLVSQQRPNAFDVVLMTEVSFFMPRFRDVIAAVHSTLRPGGLFFASFRSQFYNLLHSVRGRDWASARMIDTAREGQWGGGSVWFSWQTPEEVRAILLEHHFEVSAVRGIGVCSGIEGDPFAAIAQPSTMSEADQQHLLEIETSLSEQYACCGRYILAIATKPRSENGNQ